MVFSRGKSKTTCILYNCKAILIEFDTLYVSKFFLSNVIVGLKESEGCQNFKCIQFRCIDDPMTPDDQCLKFECSELECFDETGQGK